MKYCLNCKQPVNPEKNVSWFPLLFFTFLTGGIWLLIYGIYYCFFKSSACPICGDSEKLIDL